MNNHGNSSISKRRRLRIAQLAPLYERVPPKLYGGTERMVSFITEELVRRGHEVTLFASGDSRTCARLVPCCDGALRLSGKPELGASLQLAMLAEVYDSGRERFDIIHSPYRLLDLPILARNRSADSIHNAWAHGYRGLASRLPALSGSSAGLYLSFAQQILRPRSRPCGGYHPDRRSYFAVILRRARPAAETKS